jgi:FKBP-type peptidyl-prolyl cis-trans isomerase FkpA
MKINILTIGLLIGVLALTACSGDGYKTTDSGLKYKFHTASGGETPKVGDLLDLVIICTDESDSMFFDTRVMGQPLKLELSEPTFAGGIEEGFAMMALGDSASFIIPADSFFAKTSMEQMPAFIKPGSKLRFEVKLEKWQTLANYQKEQEEQAKELSQKEIMDREKMITEKGITAQPTASGLIYLPELEGKGAKAENGKLVEVHYSGMLLDGTVFDNSYSRGKPHTFTLGRNEVIPGWDEGIAMMKTGGKATLLIPSDLAYGPQGMKGVIPPFSTLLFEVELVSVKNP